MKSFKFINRVGGWAVFAIAAFTYLMTIEPSASFWDCGEFITTSFNLEVGHPPGDPIFMIVGRFFTLFAGSVENVAMMINILSALASAFTILFLFWSITHIAKKIIVKTEELSLYETIVVIGTGAVGALVYTFSDSFWFSAVEGEVYASSSFFTAIVFWAILKWENQPNEKYANRWIILIAYLMGLSIGVHLLNLLAIPAIVFIYYFRKYEPTVKGVLYASLISVGLLGFVMYGIIQGVIIIGSSFELVFTNDFGLPFNSGFITYIVLLVGGLIAAIYFSRKYKNVILNTISTAILVILIGYSAFAIILIRSSADPPMNQNKPDNIFELISYLNREQYGDRPLLTGQSFNAPVDFDENGNYLDTVRANYKKDKEAGKYKVVDHKLKRRYDKEYVSFFPRMYSDSESPNHVKGYLAWIGKSEKDFFLPKTRGESEQIVRDRMGNVVYDHNKPVRPPTFAENLRYFFSYQLNFMYFRYFMWNFVGRQNDIQGHGDVLHGNWISGIKFIDEWRLGNQDKIPAAYKNNKGRNTYFFLPLILGLIGIIYMMSYSGKIGFNYFWVVMLFFFFTGIAIVLYLNQPPYQPRERDYAYAGSFYVFAMFIGFGVTGLAMFLKKYIKPSYAAIIASVFGLGVAGLMAQQNWDDHDRSGRYTTRDYAKNYLSSCEPNAIIFTNGDNDTFPLWYIQEVEGFRTDVRVINLSYFNTDWYINQMRKKAYKSEPIKFSLTPDKYEQGTNRDHGIQKVENTALYIEEKYNTFEPQLHTEFKQVFDNYFEFLKNSNFKELYSEQYDVLKNGYKSVRPINLYMLASKLADKDFYSKNTFDFSLDSVNKQLKYVENFIVKISKMPIPLKNLVKHIGEDNPKYMVQTRDKNWINYLPGTKYVIPVNKGDVIKNKVVAAKDTAKIVDNVIWDIGRGYIRINDMMVLDMLATNEWKRPIYFATTVGPSNYLNLQPYFQLEGLSYRVVPIKSKSNKYVDDGSVNTDILYKNMMEKFKWGGLEKGADKLYLDENNRRFVMNFKSSFKDLIGQLVLENKMDSAEKVVDKCLKLFPNSISTWGYYDNKIGELCYKMNKEEKGDTILRTCENNYLEEFEYYFSLNEQRIAGFTDKIQRNLMFANDILEIYSTNKKTKKLKAYALKLNALMEKRFNFNAEISNLKTSKQQEQWFASMPTYKSQCATLYFGLQEILSK